VRAVSPTIEQAQPATVDAATTAAAVSAAATPLASVVGDAGQATDTATAQASNFIPATVKPAPAPVASATPGVEAVAADQLSESGSESTAVVTDAAPQVGAAAVTAAAPQTAQPDGSQSTPTAAQQTPQSPTAAATATAPPAATTTTAPAASDPVASDTSAGATTESSTPANDAATAVSGQSDAPAAKHSAKSAGPGASAHGETQTDAPTATAATAQPQGPNAGTQDAGQNGSGGQPQPSPAQSPIHAAATDAQSQPEQAAPAQAANAPAPTPGLTAGPTPQTAPTAATAAAAAATAPARYGIGLSEAVETVKTTIELGARQGFSQAKIQLAPASLGQITIHLQKTADGIVAKVVADHSAAAQTMQQGGDDLRRSLQSSGLHLLRLDIETRGDQRGSANGSAHTSQSDRTAGDNDSASAGDDGASQPTTIVLPNGALVNVLA
jgi:flagellar hook-length control protein FliK